MLYIFQIGKEHVGLKAVTEILQDIQYKVSHCFKENKNPGCLRGQSPKTTPRLEDSQKGLTEKLLFSWLWSNAAEGNR